MSGLLVALYKNQFVDMVGDSTKEEWVAKNKEGKLLCPVCQCIVIPKCGTKKTWHFAHRSYEECAGFHEAETNYHMLGKKGLYKWLIESSEEPIVEFFLRDIAQRPDLFLPKHNHAIEFQCATMSQDQLHRRIQGYQSLNIQSDWIFGLKRLTYKGNYLYLIQSTDLSAAKKDKDGHLYLNYYCPLQNQFLLLRNILPLSQRKSAAVSYRFSSKTFKHFHWLSNPFNEDEHFPYKDLWLKQKTTWRMTAFKNTSPSVMYMKKVLYFNNRSLTLFPSVAGVPSSGYYHFEASPYLWQTYLLLMIEKLSVSLFSINFIEQEFERLIQKRIIQTREFPYINESWKDALRGYLHFLETHQILEQVTEQSYKIISKIHYPKTVEEAFKLDKIFSEKT
ncbi:competence protein CoiA family protein [Fictibacillus sp. UD]